MDLALDLAGGGGGGGGWSPADGAFAWFSALVPEGADAGMSDAFEEPTLNARWTIGNAGGNFAVDGGGGAGTLDTVRHALRVTTTGNGGARIGWVAQPMPGGFTEGAFYTRAQVIGAAGQSGIRAGMLLGGAGLVSAPAVTPFVFNSRYFFTGTDGQRQDFWTAYNAFGSTVLEYQNPIGNFLRMRVRPNGANSDVYMDASADGEEWLHMGGAPYVFAGVPGAIALAADCFTAGVTAIVRFPFFAAFIGPGTGLPDATSIGRAIALPLQP